MLLNSRTKVLKNILMAMGNGQWAMSNEPTEAFPYKPPKEEIK
jgi:hypothetical protein